MPDTCLELALEAMAQSLETMAFASLAPCSDEEAPPPPSALLVRIDFAGPRRGSLELAAGEGLGRLLAANILGLEPTDNQAAAGAGDALKELANVTCGVLLPRLPAPSGERFTMDVPQLVPLSVLEWTALTSRPDAAVLDVEGHLLSIRVSEES